jgi:hypothetical protein
MAGKGKPGPAKGKGGRPRLPASKVATRNDGYKRVTAGPKGKGTQVYAHREEEYDGLPPKGSKGKGTVVDHKNRKRGDNRASNLRRVSKAANNRNKGR